MKKIILSLAFVVATILSVTAQEEVELGDKDLMYEAAYSKLMDSYVHEEKMDSAIIDLKEIIKLYPDYIDAYIATGDALSYKSYSVLDRIKNEALTTETRDSLKLNYSDLLSKSLYFFEEAYEIDNENILVIEWIDSLRLKLSIK